MTEKKEKRSKQRTQSHQDPTGKMASFIAGIPRRYIIGLGKLLGTAAYILDKRHRRIVRRNLQFTHPEWPENHVRELSKRVYQSMGISVLEILQMTCFSKEDILRSVRIRGEDNLHNALNNPNGIIVISAHIGNWEMSPLFASNYFYQPVVSVARKIRPKGLNKRICRLRTRFGNTIVDKKGALPKMARVLIKGKILGILIDQGTKSSEGVEVRFFGRTTTATPAAALLARRFDSPVLPAFCIREADYGLTLIVEPPLALQKTKDSRADLKANTQIMTDAIEKIIRSYPEQWFWFHKRWKRHYPHLYPEDLARRKRRKEREKRRADSR